MYSIDSDAFANGVSLGDGRRIVRTVVVTMAEPETKTGRAIADAKARAKQWLTDAELARAGGNLTWAEECFSRAAKWQSKAAVLTPLVAPSGLAGRR